MVLRGRIISLLLAVFMLVGIWPSQASADSPSPSPEVGDLATSEEAIDVVLAKRVGSEQIAENLKSTAPRGISRVTSKELSRSSDSSAQTCIDEQDVEICLGRSTTDIAFDPVDVPNVPSIDGFETLVSRHDPRVCTGTGTDGFRVQPIFAYVGEEAGAATGTIPNEWFAWPMHHMDGHFSGRLYDHARWDRKIRWAANHGNNACRTLIRTVQITTGATDFPSLLEELESKGAISGLLEGTTKYLIFTEGTLDPSSPETCGVGEIIADDHPLDLDQPNLNLGSSAAAVDQRCWGSNRWPTKIFPTHEFLHTLGAIQPTAPHATPEGHCTDVFDYMCEGTGDETDPDCEMSILGLDCNGDDYFNTDPITGEFTCTNWNTADSLYLEGWDRVQPPRAVPSVTATVGPGSIKVTYPPSPSCYGVAFYSVTVWGVGTVLTEELSVTFRDLQPGNYSVAVSPYSPYNDQRGDGASAVVDVTQPPPKPVPPPKPKPKPKPNKMPVGGIVLSVLDGRNYGMLGWAIDPDTGGPTRMRVTISGTLRREYGWNYWWDEMPRFTGQNRHESLVVLAQLQPGERTICLDALDAQGGGWVHLECRQHSVK